MPQGTPAFTQPWPTLVEWHGGQRWLWAPCTSEQAATLHALAAAAGGHAMLWQLPGVRETRTYAVMEEVKDSARLHLL